MVGWTSRGRANVPRISLTASNSSTILTRLLILIGLLLTTLGTSAQAQGNAGRPPFRYRIVVNSSANYPEVAKLGFGYVKFYISWDNIEATQGVFTNYPDFAVQQALANNLQIVALINNAPGWQPLLAQTFPRARHLERFVK
jgi:hypothetical protein